MELEVRIYSSVLSFDCIMLFVLHFEKRNSISTPRAIASINHEKLQFLGVRRHKLLYAHIRKCALFTL